LDSIQDADKAVSAKETPKPLPVDDGQPTPIVQKLGSIITNNGLSSVLKNSVPCKSALDQLNSPEKTPTDQIIGNKPTGNVKKHAESDEMEEPHDPDHAPCIIKMESRDESPHEQNSNVGSLEVAGIEDNRSEKLVSNADQPASEIVKLTSDTEPSKDQKLMNETQSITMSTITNEATDFSEPDQLGESAADKESYKTISGNSNNTSDQVDSSQAETRPSPDELLFLAYGNINETDESGRLVGTDMLEQFSRQMMRLEENFHAERMELQRNHTLEVDQLRASFSHEDCESQRQHLEKTHKKQLGEMQVQFHNVMQKNEGLKLKIDALKREVEGHQKLLKDRDGDRSMASEQYTQGLRKLEKEMLAAQAKSSEYEEEIRLLKLSVETASKDLESLSSEHSVLKERLKTIAGELKERRGECRELKAALEKETDEKQKLATALDDLRLTIANQGLSRSEKQVELEQLKRKLVDLKDALNKEIKLSKEKEERSRSVLEEYKKKAQNSLALANSRAAAAIQAKEEAELEARAARSTADIAMDKAVKADIESKHAVAQAKAHVKAMEEEKTQAVEGMIDAKSKLSISMDQLVKVQDNLKQSESAVARLSEELKTATSMFIDEQRKTSMLRNDLNQSSSRTSELRNHIATLREQLQRAEAAVSQENPQEKEDEPVRRIVMKETDSAAGIKADEATIKMFQDELTEANSIIDDLKEALTNAVTQHDTQKRGSGTVTGEDNQQRIMSSTNASKTSDSSSTPLFFAMEKQAELKSARDEISRLANLLSHVQSEKMEAIESVGDMRLRMEDAEARLQRYEKLGKRGSVSGSGASAANDKKQSDEENSGVVNVEYLKNIMLLYLKANTVTEKKTLLPAIFAVLCLTPDEQKVAWSNVEESSSISGVAKGLFETIGSSLL
jgi:chromosome segregation ATPase